MVCPWSQFWSCANCIYFQTAAGKEEQFQLFACLYEASMIDRKVGDKNIQFEMTIGESENRAIIEPLDSTPKDLRMISSLSVLLSLRVFISKLLSEARRGPDESGFATKT